MFLHETLFSPIILLLLFPSWIWVTSEPQRFVPLSSLPVRPVLRSLIKARIPSCLASFLSDPSSVALANLIQMLIVRWVGILKKKEREKDFPVTLLNTLAPRTIPSPFRRSRLVLVLQEETSRVGWRKRRKEGKEKEKRASLGLSCGAPAANYMQASEEDEVLLHSDTLAGHFSLWLHVGDVDNEPPASLESPQYFTPSPAAPGKKTPSVAPQCRETFWPFFFLPQSAHSPPPLPTLLPTSSLCKLSLISLFP